MDSVFITTRKQRIIREMRDYQRTKGLYVDCSWYADVCYWMDRLFVT